MVKKLWKPKEQVRFISELTTFLRKDCQLRDYYLVLYKKLINKMFFCYVILLENSRGSYWLDVFALEGKRGDHCCERILK